MGNEWLKKEWRKRNKNINKPKNKKIGILYKEREKEKKNDAEEYIVFGYWNCNEPVNSPFHENVITLLPNLLSDESFKLYSFVYSNIFFIQK